MNTSKELQNLFDDLQMNAYNSDYHTYYYKDANQIIRKHFERFEKQVKVEPEVIKKILYIFVRKSTMITNFIKIIIRVWKWIQNFIKS